MEQLLKFEKSPQTNIPQTRNFEYNRTFKKVGVYLSKI